MENKNKRVVHLKQRKTGGGVSRVGEASAGVNVGGTMRVGSARAGWIPDPPPRGWRGGPEGSQARRAPEDRSSPGPPK